MTQTATQSQKNTSRKVKALLAGGLVLGVGAAVTLAAWTDQEWAEGIFSTGSFNVQSSTTGEDESFDDHESQDGAAQLVFDLDAADNISPNETVTAPFVLRLDQGTTYDAQVDLTDAVTEGDNAANLTYSITQVASVDACAEGAEGTSVVADNTLDSVEGASSFTLESGAEDQPGVPVTLCFEVAAGNDLVQGQQTTASWQFTGTSVE